MTELWTERDLDEALEVAREQVEAADDEVYGAGFGAGAEFLHRYLIERARLSDD